MITALITGGGTPGTAGLIWSLRNNIDNRKFRIVVTDIKDNVVGKFIADKFYQVLNPEHMNYIESMKRIVAVEKVDIILIQTTRELETLSQNKDMLDCKVMVSDHESIKIANNKYLLMETASLNGIACPEYYKIDSRKSFYDAINRLNYPESPVIIKPLVSSGSRGARKLISKDKLKLDDFLSRKPGIEIILELLDHVLSEPARESGKLVSGKWAEMLVMEYLPGNEYTVDIFRDRQRNKILVFPRLRKKVVSGITFESRTEFRDDVIQSCQALADCLNLNYCFGFQFKLDQNGIPKLTECNPRIQGTTVATVMAGFNLIYYAVLDCLGIEYDYNLDVKDGYEFRRYWGGIGDGGIKLKI